MTRAAIGIGSNLGDPPRNVRRALAALERVGTVAARSRLYRSRPWGEREQPDFVNAAALLETGLKPGELLTELKRIEAELGRVPSRRWGPRAIDLDLLYYGQVRLETPELQIPHPRLRERAFVLIPLAEIDRSFRSAAAALDPSERAGVILLDEGESVGPMSDDALIDRVRVLAQAFLETDLVRLRIEEANDDAVELRKPRRVPANSEAQREVPAAAAPERLDAVKADLVGIFHFSRPAVVEGERLNGDRELGYVEALGIRNAVRSLGAGRVATIRARDGQPVDYGRVLFEIDRA